MFGNLLEQPNDRLNAASVASDLPQLQAATIGSVPTLGLAALFDLLFLVTSVLPATAPVAAALQLEQGFSRTRGVTHRATAKGTSRTGTDGDA